MRFRRSCVVLVTAVLGGGVLAPVAAHADGPVTDLYVGSSSCRDNGPGSQEEPFCSVQAAADAADPGQTVHVLAGVYDRPVTITRSGTPDAPISFVGESGTNVNSLSVTLVSSVPGTAAVTLSGVHDVRVSGFKIQPGTADAVDVLGSSDVALEQNTSARSSASTPDTAGFFVDGASSQVSITRSLVAPAGGYGVHIASGARQVTVASNAITGEAAGGVHATGVAGLDVTGNSFLGIRCSPDLAIDGATTATVEDNALWSEPPPSTGACAGAPLVSIAAEATGTVHTDYNSFYTAAPHFALTWGGTDYPTMAAFAAAVPGEAVHDLDVGPGVENAPPPDTSPLTDSGDSDAPGMTALDFLGVPRSVDDPHTANTGNGTGATDRGAFEQHSVLDLQWQPLPADLTGVAPLVLDVHVTTSDSWGEAVTTTADYGDGTGPQQFSGDSVHTFETPGRFLMHVTATDTEGEIVRRAQTVTVGTTDPPVLSFTATPTTTAGTTTFYTPDSATFGLSAGADDWELTTGNVDFGDGTAGFVSPGLPTVHQYPHPGAYTATVTDTDVVGRTVTATTTVTVGDEVLPLTPPVRAYDSRNTGGVDQVPAHATVKLSLAQLHADFGGVHAVEMTATVANPKAAGHLVVYPDGTARPNVSLLNFPAGRNVPNLVLAPAGPDRVIDFYNDSSGPVDLVVDTLGIETDGQIGDTYSPVGPVRVLDTRNGTGAVKAAVPANGEVTVGIAGHNTVPSDAEAVLLDVVTTDTKTGGHLTAYGHGTPDPGTSNSNWAAGQTVSNLVFVDVQDGEVVLHNASSGTVDFVADLVGYYHHFGTASVEMPLTPTRVLDTRTGTGTGGKVARIGAKQHLKLQISGHGGVPSAGASAAQLNLTAVTPSANGYLTLYPDGIALPTASSLNYRTGRTVANAAVTPLGPDGAIDVCNGGSSPVDVVIDLSGFAYSYAP